MSQVACSSDDKSAEPDGSVPVDPDGSVPSSDADIDGDTNPPTDGDLPDVDLSPTGDPDGDGLTTGRDNCPLASNPLQEDGDGDGIGDACDNCRNVANLDQKDANGNRIGDACEDALFAKGDEDGDGLLNDLDKCIFVADTTNADSDGDGVGDACDNCKGAANRDQADADADGVGDACEMSAAVMDRDADGVADGSDNCPDVANPDQKDSDRDLRGELCDNCPQLANYNQVDADNDKIGDVCESVTAPKDKDGDKVPDGTDNCYAVANPDQKDTDKDGVGDACDNCPAVANAGQQNSGGDAKGDACDDNELPPANTCAEATTQTSTVKPNLYFLLDRSDSMSRSAGAGLGSRISTLKAGLGTLFGNNANPGAVVRNFQVGIGAFPLNWTCSENQLPEQVLPLRITPARTADELRMRVDAVNPTGWTPTDMALRRVRTQQLFNASGDTMSARPKAVVLITDGSPNSCEADNANRVTQTVAEAGKLAKLRIPVYVLGFAGISPDVMAAIAYAGDPANASRVPAEACTSASPTNCICTGGSNCTPYTSMKGTWFEVSSSQSITTALSGIISRSVSCSLPVTPAPGRTFDPNIARVRFLETGAPPGVPLARNTDYTILGNTVTLVGSACTRLQNAVGANANARVEVDLGCACTPSAEVCSDDKDNDCDGLVNEGCPATDCVPGDTRPACNPEICDGKDNDQDGTIDEGCEKPACVPSPEICNDKDDDCDGTIDEGCDGCTPFTEICGDTADSDCDGIDDPDEPGCVMCPNYANEVCDFKDNDCDGEVDEGCPGTVI